MHLSTTAGGILAVSAPVPAPAVGGSALGSTQIAATCLTKLSLCAAAVRYVVLGKLLRTHLKAGTLTLRIKPSNRRWSGRSARTTSTGCARS